MNLEFNLTLCLPLHLKKYQLKIYLRGFNVVTIYGSSGSQISI